MLAAISADAPAAAQVMQGPLFASEIPLSYSRGHKISVLERARPQYDAVGMRFGAFVVRPQIEFGAGYYDNIYGRTTDPVGDAIVSVEPSVSIASDWGSHNLIVSASADIRRFADASVRNETALAGQADGRIDVSRDLFITAGASAQRTYEERYSGSSPVDALADVEYLATGGYLRGNYTVGPVRSLLSIDANRLSFNDVRATDGGILDQGNRDRLLIRLSARSELWLTPDISAFAQFSYTDIGYDRRVAGHQDNRDAGESRALVGLSFDLMSPIRGRLGVGYIRRQFESPLYPSISGPALEARIEYFLSGLTTITLGGRRYVQDSDIGQSGGYFATGGSVRIDHELLRNLLLNASFDYERDDFRGIRRDDRIVSLSAGAQFLHRMMGYRFDITAVDRKSWGELAGLSFRDTRATFTLVWRR